MSWAQCPWHHVPTMTECRANVSESGPVLGECWATTTCVLVYSPWQHSATTNIPETSVFHVSSPPSGRAAAMAVISPSLFSPCLFSPIYLSFFRDLHFFLISSCVVSTAHSGGGRTAVLTREIWKDIYI